MNPISKSSLMFPRIMKHLNPKYLCAVGAVSALLFGAVSGSAQTVTSSITNKFDDASSVTGWTYWYDMYHGQFNTILLQWDGTKNNGGAAGSGSVLYTNLWPGTAAGVGGNGGQAQIWGTFAHTGASQYDQSQTIDISKYDSITFDVLANPGCPTNANGNVCQLTVGFWTVNYQVHGTTNVNIPTSATSAWYHVTALVNKSETTNLASGWALNINCYGGPNTVLFTNAGAATYLWIDNIQVNRSKEVTPPPTISPVISGADPGLNLYLGPNQYDRTGLKLPSASSWMGAGSDTTYAFTISKFPDTTAYPNNQAHIFVASPNGASSLDYNTPNLLWLNVQGNANGTATAYFRYKINEPNSNSNLFGADFTGFDAWAGQIAQVTASSPIGTWGMTINQDTNVTMFGPGGVSTNFTLHPEVLTAFAGASGSFVDVVFGAQPNNTPVPAGQAVVLTHAVVTNSGGGVTADDDFLADDGVLNTTLWTISSANPSGVQLYPNDPGQKIVKWSLPDNYFDLQVSTNGLFGPWTYLTGLNAASPVVTFNSGGKNAVVPSSFLNPKQTYFRLAARKFTKLQVLLPGESADPGSLTGKTGTPDQQSLSFPYPVTVNAVDANWFPAGYNSDHTIHLTSTDGTAGLPPNFDLVGGTASVQVTNNVSGTFTFTASDVTDPTKTSNTSSPVTVP
jgi:hypothetical protein